MLSHGRCDPSTPPCGRAGKIIATTQRSPHATTSKPADGRAEGWSAMSIENVQGITNEVEPGTAGWAIWVHGEDEVEKARGYLDQFQLSPDDPQYWRHHQTANAIKEQEVESQRRAANRFHDRMSLFRTSVPYRMGLVTLILVAASIGFTILMGLDVKNEFRHWFAISESFTGLPEVRRGEIWRLITPIFIHGGPLHLLFNMLWLVDLGSMIEARETPGRLVRLVFVSAALSNMAEYYLGGHGPHFSGMSGVVYALVGYVWIKGHLHPASGLQVQPSVMLMTMIWFILCWLRWIPNIANYCHTGGLIVGLVWGTISSKLATR